MNSNNDITEPILISKVVNKSISFLIKFIYYDDPPESLFANLAESISSFYKIYY